LDRLRVRQNVFLVFVKLLYCNARQGLVIWTTAGADRDRCCLLYVGRTEAAAVDSIDAGRIVVASASHRSKVTVLCCTLIFRGSPAEWKLRLSVYSKNTSTTFRLVKLVSVFLPRDAMQARLCRHAVSVCPSVRLSCSRILSKRINISSIFFYDRVATPF